ncbi:MAG: hypothetical protein R6U44_08805 [Archaeoglobaceae archaeon]
MTKTIPDERIDIRLYLSEDPRRFEVLKTLELENRRSISEIARKLGFFSQETKDVISDVEALGLTDTLEEFKDGELTFMSRLSNRGAQYLKDMGVIAAGEEEEEGAETEEAAGEGAESEEGS